MQINKKWYANDGCKSFSLKFLARTLTSLNMRLKDSGNNYYNNTGMQMMLEICCRNVN